MLEELTLRKAIEFAVTTEELGAKFYARAASRFESDAEVGAVFAQLARDEEAHARAVRCRTRRTRSESPRIGSSSIGGMFSTSTPGTPARTVFRETYPERSQLFSSTTSKEAVSFRTQRSIERRYE